MILATVAHTLPDGYPWVALGWSVLGFGGGYVVGRAHCWRRKRKRGDCDT